jgi:hypothetical protein
MGGSVGFRAGRYGPREHRVAQARSDGPHANRDPDPNESPEPGGHTSSDAIARRDAHPASNASRCRPDADVAPHAAAKPGPDATTSTDPARPLGRRSIRPKRGSFRPPSG